MGSSLNGNTAASGAVTRSACKSTVMGAPSAAWRRVRIVSGAGLADGATTLFDKIWSAHEVGELPGGRSALVVDRMTLHELSGGYALRDMQAAGKRPHLRPDQVFAVADHAMSTSPDRGPHDSLSPAGSAMIASLEQSCGAFGRRYAPPDDPAHGNRARCRAGTGLRSAGHDACLRGQSHLHRRRVRRTCAVFDREIALDADGLAPQVSWGTTPGQTVDVTGVVPDPAATADGPTRAGMAKALAYMQLEPGWRLDTVPVDAAFIGSCTNARITDLRAAAAILRGRHVADGVWARCTPGSMAVRAQAEAEGLDRVFADAGFEWRKSGCSNCAGREGRSGRTCAWSVPPTAISKTGRGHAHAPILPARPRSRRRP